MAKYSTGKSGSSSGGETCELCGERNSSLSEASIAGATLQVCPDCAPHDDSTPNTTGSDGAGESDRKRDVVKRATAETATLWDSDTTHWEQDGAGYDDDPLPYLIPEYAEVVKEAREDAGLDVSELARTIEVDELAVLAVERGKAVQNNVGGGVIEALEDELSIDLKA